MDTLIKYKITLEIEGKAVLPLDDNTLQHSEKLRNKLKQYVQKTLGCRCVVKECLISKGDAEDVQNHKTNH